MFRQRVIDFDDLDKQFVNTYDEFNNPVVKKSSTTCVLKALKKDKIANPTLPSLPNKIPNKSPMQIVEPFDYKYNNPLLKNSNTFSDPSSVFNPMNTTMKQGVKTLAKKKLPEAIPPIKAWETLTTSMDRIEKAIVHGTAPDEASICGAIGGYTQALTTGAGHALVWSATGAAAGLGGVGGYLAAGTILTTGTLAAPIYGEMLGNAAQQLCHITYEERNRKIQQNRIPSEMPIDPKCFTRMTIPRF